jgi:hypothetical protein
VGEERERKRGRERREEAREGQGQEEICKETGREINTEKERQGEK